MKRALEYLLFFLALAVFLYLARGKFEAFFYNQGNGYSSRGFYRQAVNSYENALKINPQSWLSRLALADAYRDVRDYQRAADEYVKVLESNPLCQKAYQSLSEIYSRQGLHPEAMAVIVRGQEKIPGDPKIRKLAQESCYAFIVSTLDQCADLFLKGRSQDAISVLKETLEYCPDFAIAQYTLGYYYSRIRDYENARASLEKAILLDPQFHHAYKLLSEVYFKKGDFEKELFYAKKAIELNNNDASLYNDLGLALMHLERYPEALDYLKKAVSLDPDNPDYAYSLGSVYRDNKMPYQAIAEYNRLNVLKSDYPNLHNDLGDIYDILGDVRQASLEYSKEERYCRQAILNSPGNPILLNNYAYALNGLGESGKAKKIIEEVISAHPAYRQAYITLSRINDKMQDAGSALKAMEKAKSLSAGEDFIDEEISRLNKRLAVKEKPAPGPEEDTIYLKNGRQIRGKVKKEYPDKVVIEVVLGSSVGEVVFYRDSIGRMEKARH